MGTITKTLLVVFLFAASAIATWCQITVHKLQVKEGQTTVVPGTNLSIQVVSIKDFTSEGCEGGPGGCPDFAQLSAVRGKERQEVKLYVAHTQVQEKQGINKKIVFGSTIVLTGLQRKTASFTVQAAPAEPKPEVKK